MNLTQSVTATTDQSEARSATWENVQYLMNDGLPLPAGVAINADGYLSITFDDLTHGNQWADAMGLTLQGAGVRQPTDRPGRVITFYTGSFRDGRVALWVHEDAPAEVDVVQRVEAHIGEPKLPQWMTRDGQTDPNDEVTTVLKCPCCALQLDVSTEDPDATLSDMERHIRGDHADNDPDEALRLLAKVEEVRS